MKSKLIRTGMVLLVLAVIVFFIPAVLSSSLARGKILGRINRSAPGTLAVDNWKLTWASGLSVSGIAYRDASAGLDASVEKVEAAKGLAHLILSRGRIGDIAVVNPRVRLEVPEKPAETPPPGKSPRRGEGKPAPQKPSPEKQPPPKKPSGRPLELPELFVDFKLTGGRVDIVAPGGLSTQVVDQIEAAFAMKGSSEPVVYDLSCSMTGGGSLLIKGKTTLPADGKLVPEQIAATAEITAADVDLAPLTEWLDAQSPAPVVHTLLNANLNAEGDLAAGIRVRGAVRLPGTKLTGAALKGDEPDLGDITVLVNALCSADVLEIESLMLESEAVKLKVSGRMGKSAPGAAQADGSVNLAVLAREFPSTLGLQEGVELSEGLLQFAGKISRTDQTTEFEASAGVEALRGSRSGEAIAWDAPTRIEIRGRQGGGAFSLDHFAVTSPFMSASGSGDLSGLQLQLDASLDKTLAETGEFVDLGGIRAAGNLSLKLQAGLDAGAFAVKTDGSLTALEIALPDKEPLREESVEFAAAARIEPSGAFALDSVSLNSQAVQLDAKAGMKQSGGSRSVQASGELGLDLDRLAGYVRALTGMDLQMSGRQRRPFEFVSEWSADEPGGLMKNARLEAGLQADLIKAFGLEVSGLDIPVKIAGGRAVIDITAGVNGGRLAVHPEIDFNAVPVAVVLRDPTNLLAGVQLTDQLANELLAKFHPVFRGSAGVTGELALAMQEFHWPLDPALRPQARFNGAVRFRGLQMVSHGLLEKLLEVMKVRERSVNFGDRSIDFRCENDRVTCSPLTFKVDGHDVTLAGSMGLDQSLDYVAQIPLTRELVGGDAAKYLDGTTVRVPIRGTASKPELNSKALSDAAGDLIKQAAKKALQDEAGKLLEGLFK